MSSVYLLRRPSGGSAKKQASADALLATFARLDRHVIDLTGSSAAESAASLRDAVASGLVERVVVAGGDGVVHLAIQELATTNIALGIIPSGTGNDFATALGITDADPGASLTDPSPVDLLRVSSEGQPDQWIASIAIIGFPANINARANQIRIPLGPAVYTVAAALELPQFSRTIIELMIDGETVTTDSAMLAIGNTRFFGGGMLACPDATATDGLAHLTSIESVGRVGILRHLTQKAGGSADRPEVRRATATTYEIQTPDLALWGDGEPIATTPLTIRLVPGALHVAGHHGGGNG